MKKLFCILGITLLMTGCGMMEDLDNTPTKQVEAYLNSYQKLDDNVLNDLDNVLDEDYIFNETQRNKYREIVKKSYQELSYEIKEEKIDGDNATVTAEIEVIDHAKVIKEADTYLKDNQEEFNDTDGKYDINLFTDYRISQLEKNKEKIKYTINFRLTKENNDWVLKNPTETELSKINGTYIH